jgi:hypothetical protein
MDFLTDNAVGLFIVIVAPGFLSLKIWSLIHPSKHTSFADSLYEAIFYGVINFFIITVWLPPLLRQYHIVWYILSYVFSLLVIPMILPVVLHKILNSRYLKKKIINPTPKAWDYFFGTRQPCFMLIHMKNQQIIGGLYNTRSFVSSYPEEADIYLEQVWDLNDDGTFDKPIDSSLGLLINYEAIEYIEFFQYNTTETGVS